MHTSGPIYLEKRGWFTSSPELKIQSHKSESSFSFCQAIKAIALGILAASQSFRTIQGPMQGLVPALGLHLWSQIPTTYAQTTQDVLVPTLIPKGDEFQVNTNTFGNQIQPILTFLDNGELVVVWTSKSSAEPGNVFGQIFDKNCAKSGPELPINTYLQGDQTATDLALLSDNNFAVAWQSANQDGSGYGSYGQVLNKTGEKVGNEFQANTYTENYQYAPSVVRLKTGGFIFSWTSIGQISQGYDLFAQLFNKTREKVGNEFLINNYTMSDQADTDLADLEDDRFVAVWHSIGQDGDGYGVFGQLFDETGIKIGEEFPIATYNISHQASPKVAPLKNGGFVVVWRSPGQDGSFYGVFRQLFDKDAIKIGNEIPVNTYTLHDQYWQDVASFEEGGHIVVWASNKQDGDGWGVYGQAYDEAGEKIGNEFPINIHTVGNQTQPRVATFGRKIAVTWQSDSQDGDGWGIFGRIFQLVFPTTFGTTLPTTSKTSTNSPTSKTSNQLPLLSPTSSSLKTSLATTSLTTREIVSISEVVKTSTLTQPISSSTIESIPTPMNTSDPLIFIIATCVAALACSMGGAIGFYFARRSKSSAKETDTELSALPNQQPSSEHIYDLIPSNPNQGVQAAAQEDSHYVQDVAGKIRAQQESHDHYIPINEI